MSTDDLGDNNTTGRTQMIKYWIAIIGLGTLCGCTTVSKDGALSNQARDAIQSENYDKAQTLLEEALEINPKNAYAWLNLGVVHQSQEDFEKAKECYMKVVQYAWDEMAANKEVDGKSLVRIARENLERMP